MRYGRSNNQEVPIGQRKLKTKPVLLLLGVLLLGNIVWMIAFISASKAQHPGEEVARVAGKPITREEWLSELEKEAGRETLLAMVNDRVMEAAAKKYKISVSDKEIDVELALIRSAGGADVSYIRIDDELVRKQLRSELILEKVLTKDVVVSDEAIATYYEDNRALFNLPTASRVSLIVTSTKEEAKQTVDEFKNGSSFDALARERSVDRASASLGGDIGYIVETTETVDQAIVKEAMKLKVGSISEPIALRDGSFAVIRVTDRTEGQSFKLKEVSDHIRRTIALQQIPQTVNPEMFWEEFDAEWFYGK